MLLKFMRRPPACRTTTGLPPGVAHETASLAGSHRWQSCDRGQQGLGLAHPGRRSDRPIEREGPPELLVRLPTAPAIQQGLRREQPNIRGKWQRAGCLEVI